MKPTVYAIDFDGTLAVTEYPTIIKPIESMIQFCRELHDTGNLLILNTCRVGKELYEAVEWCESQGLRFDAVNKNLESRIIEFGGDCRKISADYYIDDRNIHPIDIVATNKNMMWWKGIKNE